MRYISLGGESWYFLRVGPSTPARRHPSTAELGALGLVLRRVALEVGERVERRRREPGEEGQRADGEARQRRRDESTPPREASRLVASAGPTSSVEANTVVIDTQAQAMPKSSLKTLKSPERGSFINCRSTMLIRVKKMRGCLVVNAGVALRR